LEANSQSVAINVEYKLETDEGGQKTSADNNDNGEQTDSNDDDNDNDASVQNETFNKNIVNTKQADVAETTISGDVTNTENVYTTVTNDNNASKSSPKTGSDNNNVFWMVMIAISCSGIVLLLVFRKKICKEALMFLGVLTVGAVVVGISFQTKADETNTVTKVISVSKNVSVGGETVTFSARVFYDGIDENSTTDNTGNLEVDLGEDVVPDLDFTPEEAEPTFASEYDEIANLSELNGGEVPYSLSDDNGTPNYIDGKFSDKSVNSAGEAIKALNDIHYSMGFENAEQEFEKVYSDSVEIPNQEVTNFYRLQQTYHNIPVYGYQLIVSTDTSGNIESLTGHYYPNIEVDINPTISMDDAKNIVSENESSSESVSDGLYICKR
jgi:LPXTG-motif cell wall-anchored protein